jgi:hypothetical protein
MVLPSVKTPLPSGRIALPSGKGHGSPDIHLSLGGTAHGSME